MERRTTMTVKFTARHFHAHPELKSHAQDAVKKLHRFYDGIVAATVVLSFERTTNSVKTAEINLQVYGALLSASVSTDDFMKSIDAATEKLGKQLAKYKTKLRAKDKSKVRAIKQKS
jgi:putative sigma-54 modulation protein